MIVSFAYEIKNMGVCFNVSSIVLKEVVKMDNLLKMKKIFYMLALMILPLILMFLLHMCIAMGNLSGTVNSFAQISSDILAEV